MLTATIPGTTRAAIDRLALFQNVFNDPIGQRFQAAIEAKNTSDATERVSAFRRLTVAIVGRAELAQEPLVGNSWQDWLVERIVTDDNVLMRKLERVPLASIGATLRSMALDELNALSLLYRTTEADVLQPAPAAIDPERLSWSAVHTAGRSAVRRRRGGRDQRRRLAACLAVGDAAGALTVLARSARAGLGIFGRFLAFRWTGHDLAGISQPDPIRLANLVGYDRERQPVLQNTRQFVAGLPANDVLLSGARGTGKSSTVKALLNEYGSRGLRVVEVPKEHLIDLSAILNAISGRPERFILFVDDLSFEESETHYKALKALLEGTIEARPANVVIYATSNRRNLITERWGERAPGDDEVNPRERLEEKLSLADRFGIRVFFPAPDQEHYLAIVESLARDAGIGLPAHELRQRAIRWELLHSGRSGRVARQFVVSLLGEQIDKPAPVAG